MTTSDFTMEDAEKLMNQAMEEAGSMGAFFAHSFREMILVCKAYAVAHLMVHHDMGPADAHKAVDETGVLTDMIYQHFHSKGGDDE